MKIILDFKYYIFIGIVLAILSVNSCANTKGAPTGGPKDTIPPVIVALMPKMNATDIPREKSHIAITFNEYVQIKEANKNVLLSPPLKKKVETKIKGKSIIVTFPQKLDSARTYSIHFGSSIIDNNENNPLTNFVYSFSTGKTVDSLLFSGNIYDNASLMPVEGISISLYEHPTDSCVLNKLPDAITKSDKWGYFCLRNLKPVKYAIFAFKDENQNYMYDQDNESIAFADSMITPKIPYNAKLPQVTAYDIKDTLHNISRPSELEMYLFKERPTKQFLTNKGRTGLRAGFVKFNAPDVQIDSFSIKHINNKNIIKEFNNINDSLSFWINDSRKLDDTLFLGIKYMKTDTLGVLRPSVENLKLVMPRVDKKKEEQQKKEEREKIAKGEKVERKDLLKFKLTSNGESIEETGYIFEFNDPLISIATDSITLSMSNPKKIVTKEEFEWLKDSLSIRKYFIKPKNGFKVGNEYILNIKQATFKDINGFTNDSLVNKVSLPTDDKLSSITLNVTNVKARYIVELVNDKRNTVYRRFIITNDKTLQFKYLKPENYAIRITEDLNGNELLDPGSLLKHKQPEKVKLYKLENGKEIIIIKERIDLEQSIDVNKLFGND